MICPHPPPHPGAPHGSRWAGGGGDGGGAEPRGQRLGQSAYCPDSAPSTWQSPSSLRPRSGSARAGGAADSGRGGAARSLFMSRVLRLAGKWAGQLRDHPYASGRLWSLGGALGLALRECGWAIRWLRSLQCGSSRLWPSRIPSPGRGLCLHVCWRQACQPTPAALSALCRHPLPMVSPG